MKLSEIRMKEHSGLVTNDTSTTKFSFIISPIKNKAQLEQNDYVALNHASLGESCPILAIITAIHSYEQITGSTLGEKVGKMMANAEIIGYVNTKNQTKRIQKLVIPPNPGSRVFMPYSEFIQEVFTTNSNGKKFNPSLHIAKSIQTAITKKDDKKQLDYYLDSKNVTKTHCLITAIDGSGKTQTAKIIIEELATKTNQPIIVFDPYNEYITTKTNNTQSALIKHKTVNITCNSQKIEQEKLLKEIKSKQVTSITTQNETPEKKSKLYSQTLKTLWNARLQQIIAPFTLVIENPEKIDTTLLEQVVYNGTKHGLALILLSKQPSKLGPTILSQMTTTIIGKTADSKYLKTLKTILPQYVRQIPQLKQQQWIINTNSQKQITQIETINLYT